MDTEYYTDEAPAYLLKFRKFLHYLLIPILALLIAVLYLEFFVHLGHSAHKKLKIAEKIILFYFIGEVATDFILFDDKREFLSEKWFDILLIIPFLQAFRAVGRAGRLFRGIKAIKSLQIIEFSQVARFMKALRIGEIPLVTGMVAGEGARGLRIGKSLSKGLKYVPKLQKLLHFIRGSPELVRQIPKIQSVVYILSQVKIVAKKAIFLLLPTSILIIFKTSRDSDE